MMAWVHRYVLLHQQVRRKVSVPLWDAHAKGVRIVCQCGRTWAL